MPELVDGRYELLEVLASGGMATVWRARDVRLDRVVALKRPHPAPPNDPVHQRLEREARAAASLNHPHLVTVFDSGRDDAGPYLVMEMVDGPTLADVGGELDRTGIMEVGAQIASALAAVHEAGIVHRDVKPTNILMSDRGPQLTDFGIALSPDATSQLTQPGRVIGTPAYAAPEVLAGRPPTSRSDVFSLAVVIYELVSGRAPYEGTDRSTPVPAVDDPHLDSLLRQALSPRPEDRPDASAFEARMRSLAPTQGMAAVGGSTMVMDATAAATPSVDPSGPPSRPASLWWLGGVGLVVLLVLAAMSGLGGDDPPQAAADTNPPAASSTSTSTTVATTTTTTVPTTTTIATTTTEPAFEDDEVMEARTALEEALGSAHPSDLNPPDMRDLMEKVDEAIELVAEDKSEQAEKKLEEVRREIDEKLEGETRREAQEALEQLASALDISLEEEEDDDDDDDD